MRAPAKCIALLTSLLATGGCRSIPEGRFACADDVECPPGTTCASGRCWASPPIASCGDPAARPHVEVTAEIAEDTTWGCGTIWELTTEIDVRARLTIEAGTRVIGRSGAGLLVRPDGVLIARGTVNDPIVFSGHALTSPGEWHGITMLGHAPVNDPGATWMDVSSPFGGTDPTHSCGELEHVRIELAGEELHDGLTLAGCGTGTVISHVQSHRSAQDGVSVLGGTTNMDHVVITGATRNGLEWTLGWTGRVQFIVVQSYVGTTGSALTGSNRMLAFDAIPRSDPTIYNATLFGSGSAGGGVYVTQGTWLLLSNAIFFDFRGFAVDATGASTYAGVLSGEVRVQSSIFHRIGLDGMTYTDAADPNDAMMLGELNSFEDPDLTSVDPFDPRPTAADGPTSMGTMRAAPGFENVRYRGALAYGDTWLDGWTTGLPTSAP